MDKMSEMITPQEKELISIIRETKEGSIRVKIENSEPAEIERESEAGPEQDKSMFDRPEKESVDIASA